MDAFNTFESFSLYYSTKKPLYLKGDCNNKSESTTYLR